jgi:alcohol dehydrogenase (cytochrome c)
VGDLFDLVSNTMPENDPGGLKAEEYANILAFFLSESGYKEGARELPSDLESLKHIRIDVPAK